MCPSRPESVPSPPRLRGAAHEALQHCRPKCLFRLFLPNALFFAPHSTFPTHFSSSAIRRGGNHSLRRSWLLMIIDESHVRTFKLVLGNLPGRRLEQRAHILEASSHEFVPRAS